MRKGDIHLKRIHILHNLVWCPTTAPAPAPSSWFFTPAATAPAPAPAPSYVFWTASAPAPAPSLFFLTAPAPKTAPRGTAPPHLKPHPHVRVCLKLFKDL